MAAARPAGRKAAKALPKPDYFPPENVLTRALPPELARERDFENYHFIGFDWSQANLSGWRFSECLFENCSLAGAQLSNAALQNVAFAGCKLLGAPFHACRDLLFGVHFDQCQLDYATFVGRAMPHTRFVGCSLQEADFTSADLTEAAFENCTLRRAVFQDTILTRADFRTAQEVELDPALNHVQQARFSLHSLPGLLTRFDLQID